MKLHAEPVEAMHHPVSADVVSSLSIDFVRRVMKAIRPVDEYTQSVHIPERLKLHTGRLAPPERLDLAIEMAKRSSLNKKQGAPELMIPAQMIVWLDQKLDDSYATMFVDPRNYSQRLTRYI